MTNLTKNTAAKVCRSSMCGTNEACVNSGADAVATSQAVHSPAAPSSYPTTCGKILSDAQSQLGKFLTVSVAADIIRVSERTLNREIDDEDLATHEFRGAVRISETDFAAYVRKARRPARRSQKTSCGPGRFVFDKFFLVAEVATLVGVSLRTVKRDIAADLLATHQFRDAVRISNADLQSYIRQSRRTARARRSLRAKSKNQKRSKSTKQ